MRKTTQLAMAILFLAGTGLAAFAQSVSVIITNGLSEPYAVAVDQDNNYYITDSATHRILLYTPDTGSLTNLAGRQGLTGLQDGRGIFARFYSPQGIVRARGGLVVADSGNHVIRFVTLDGTVSTIAGKGQPDYADGGGPNAGFNYPTGLSVDAAGNVYIADSLNNAIRKLDTNNFVTTIAASFVTTNSSGVRVTNSFFRPQGVTIGDDGILYVADTGNHSVVQIPVGANVGFLMAGSGTRFAAGNLDSLISSEARFTTPRAVFSLGGTRGLVISDSGNSLLRRVYYNTNVNTYSVERYATVAAGLLATPIGMARDLSGNVLLADLGNSSLLSIQVQGTVLARVPDPRIGFVVSATDSVGYTLVPTTNETFFNDQIIAVTSEKGTQTFFTLGPSADAENLPNPASTNSSPPVFSEGQAEKPRNLVSPFQPDVTIKLQSTLPDRRPSNIVLARYRWQVSNPSIIGRNPASFTLETVTDNAEMWYTTDGSTPTNGVAPAKLYTEGTALNVLKGTNDVVFRVRGFKTGYSPSAVIQQVFSYTNLQTSLIGFDQDFTAGIGSTLIAPVQIKPAPNDTISTLQFRVEVRTVGAAPPLTLPLDVLKFGPNDFVVYQGASPVLPNFRFNYVTNYADGSKASGVAIGFVATNSEFKVGNGTPVTVALLGIPVPKTSKVGDQYRLSIVFATATSDGFQAPVPVSSLDDQLVTVSEASYIVGDTAAATGYNAVNFGNKNLDNNDVNNAFYASIGLRIPFPNTDVFDAMDAFPLDEDGSPGGDGQIRFLDWQYILLRSLRLDTNNWIRSWGPGGFRRTTRTTITNTPPLIPPRASSPATQSISDPTLAWYRPVELSGVTQENTSPGTTVEIPVYVKPRSGNQLAGFQFRARVDAERSAPSLAQAISFRSSDRMPQPASVAALPGNELVAAWSIGQFGAALTSSTLVGYVRVQIPLTAAKGDSYILHFSYADGAPNLTQQYSFDTLPVRVWVLSTAAIAPDRISDEWKQNFFGSVTAQVPENGDADGDGFTNLQEYLAGTNPNSRDWHYQLKPEGFAMRWFAESGKKYSVQVSSDLKTWSDVGSQVTGDDQMHENVDAGAGQTARFYRVQTVQ